MTTTKTTEYKVDYNTYLGGVQCTTLIQDEYDYLIKNKELKIRSIHKMLGIEMSIILGLENVLSITKVEIIKNYTEIYSI